MSGAAEQPSPEITERRKAALYEHIRMEREFYTRCALLYDGMTISENEPLVFNDLVCVYPTKGGDVSPDKQVIEYTEFQASEHPLSPQGFRQRLMAYKIPSDAIEAQTEQRATWEDPRGKTELLELAAKLANAEGSPIAFIAIGKSEHDGREVAMLFHHPCIPSSGALELLQQGADDTLPDSTG